MSMFNGMEQPSLVSPVEIERSPTETAVLEKMKRIIQEAPQKIEEELPITGSGWIAAYTNKLSALRMSLQVFLMKEPEAAPRYQGVIEKFTAVTNRKNELAVIYPNSKTPPPEDVKQEL